VHGFEKQAIMELIEMPPVTLEELPRWSKLLNHKSASEIMETITREFEGRVGLITAFGYSGTAMLHMIRELELHKKIRVYFIDTGYHFKETLEYARRIEKEWDLDVVWKKADSELRNYMLKTIGEKPWEANNNLCCHYCKVDPLLRFLPENDVWLSALRKDQSYTRSSIEKVEIDGRGTFRVYPIADWKRKKVWDYIHDRRVPYNPLYDQGYMSIGCEPCTLPVGEGGDERDGRWKLSQKLECGIHVHR
jgi:phosphoadenosine phosphosulfate reductase